MTHELAHIERTDGGLRELALFAGAGGGILGGHLLGWRCVCAVEWEPYPCAVLAQRQNEGILPPFPIWDDVRSFDGTPWRGLVDVVSGGFPCQDISSAGKGAGIEGERSGMWKEMARIIGEVRPRYVLVENSPVLTSRGLGVVLGDLSTLGYDAEWGVVGADDAGAPHRRERIWILAHANPDGAIGWGSGEVRRYRNDAERLCEALPNSGNSIGQLANANMLGCLHGQAEEQPTEGRQYAQREPEPSGADVADAIEKRSQHQEKLCELGRNIRPALGRDSRGRGEREPAAAEWWATEPGLGRVANGVAARVDRLKAIGNGQVPAVVVLAWKTLQERIQVLGTKTRKD